MNHLSEEQLILHYYGETGDTLECEFHLDECSECREVYASLQRVLNVVDGLPLPDPGEDYGARVWQRIEPQIPHHRRWWFAAGWRWAAAAAVCASLLVAAFLAGRVYPRPTAANQVAADTQAREHVLRVAVGDYLERSQMVLVELTNANPSGPLDISAEQERAGDLVTETRLYRQTADRMGDTRIATVLDELEPVLVDISHAPSDIAPEQLATLRQRVQDDDILFKIRVVGSNVRQVPVNGPPLQRF
jgi:hypothetical protein